MNIAIVGAGITGISTALEFARDGHQVTVYEQMNAAAEDASFAPGGWLSPLVAQSLAAPGAGMPLKSLRSGASLLQAPGMLGSANWRWMRQWKKNGKLAHKQGNQPFCTALHTLGSYSASLRWQNCDDTEMAAEHKAGSLVLLRTPQEVAFWNTQLASLQAQGVTCQLLNATQTQALEPGLGQEIAWLNALHFPDSESINPRLWAHYLRMQAQAWVRFSAPVYRCRKSARSLLASKSLGSSTPLTPSCVYRCQAPAYRVIGPATAIDAHLGLQRDGTRARRTASAARGHHGLGAASHHQPHGATHSYHSRA